MAHRVCPAKFPQFHKAAAWAQRTCAASRITQIYNISARSINISTTMQSECTQAEAARQEIWGRPWGPARIAEGPGAPAP